MKLHVTQGFFLIRFLARAVMRAYKALCMELPRIVSGFAFAILALSACSSPPRYPNCGGDRECQQDGHHEWCIQGHCQTCRTNSDCAAGQVCTNNRCESAPVARAQCDDTHACSTGQDCLQGHCVAAHAGVGAYSNDGGQCTFPEIHFAFDDATLDAPARDGLQQTSDCLRREATTHYVLIGRADPRGTAEYNVALGARRARSVQHFLIALGTSEPRLAVSSLGSEGAAGGDEASYAQDRRVDTNRRDADAGHP